MINHAILKIAQYHIEQGHHVKWYEPLLDQDADVLYVSKIFTFTNDIQYLPVNAKIIKGGTGYKNDVKLPEYIEKIMRVDEAYQLLYHDKNYSILFTTRGCVRNCAFCVVREKEGYIHDVPSISLNPNGKHIELMDNNFFSTPTWCERLTKIKRYNIPVNFNTGIDIREITEAQAKALSTLRIKRIHCAWDYYHDKEKVINGLTLLTKYVSPSLITVYVLVGFQQPYIVSTDVERVKTLWEQLKVYPFAMPYINVHDGKRDYDETVKDFCRWTNRYLFKKMNFENYKGRK